MTLTYKTIGVCSTNIIIEIDESNHTIEKVEFLGGCRGNTKGVASLCEGMKVSEVYSRLSGIKCGYRDTSCPDQLANALAKYMDEHM